MQAPVELRADLLLVAVLRVEQPAGLQVRPGLLLAKLFKAIAAFRYESAFHAAQSESKLSSAAKHA